VRRVAPSPSALADRADRSGGIFPPACRRGLTVRRPAAEMKPQPAIRGGRTFAVTPPPSFDELLRRVRAGDEQAAARLVHDFEPFIRRDIRFRLRDPRLRRLFDSLALSHTAPATFFVPVARRQLA